MTAVSQQIHGAIVRVNLKRILLLIPSDDLKVHSE